MNSPKRTSLLEVITHFWDLERLHNWALPYHDQRGARAFWMRQIEIFVLTLRSLYREEITLRSAALTYRTMLSLVPILATAFALFKAFGGLQKLQAPLKDLILENLAAGRGEEVGAWFADTIENINAGAIAGVSVLFLFYTAVGLLTNIEGSFNRIFGIERGRPFLTRFFIYWGLLTLSPPLIGLSLSLSTQLQDSAIVTAAVNWLPFGLGQPLLSLGSALATCLVFVFSYSIVPNTMVHFRAALLGGVVAGLIWNLSKFLFIALTAGSIKYSAIYGALGVLPLLMLWIYLSWIIVLFGATYTFANQSVHRQGLDLKGLMLSQDFRERLAARLMLQVAENFVAGRPPLSSEDLAERAGTMTSTVERVSAVLVDHGLLSETQGKREERCFLPGQSLKELSLARVIATLRQDGWSYPLAQEDAGTLMDDLLDRAQAASARVLAEKDMHALAGESSALTSART